jgi:hypothetical protein
MHACFHLEVEQAKISYRISGISGSKLQSLLGDSCHETF